VLAQTQSIGASTGSLRGSARWLAPELIGNMGPTSTEYLPIPRTHTTATDVWAFGMVILVSTVFEKHFVRPATDI
jgi:serine/threonine protein kinase